MKKRYLTVALAAALALALALCAGCVKGQEALDELQQDYAAASQANEIHIKIESKFNKLLQYSSDAVYTKTGSGYEWTKTTKTINEIDQDTTEAYTTETTSGSETANASFVPSLTLDEQYFVAGYQANGKHLDATVRVGNEQAVLGYTDYLLTSVNNLNIKMDAAKGRVTQLVMTFEGDKFSETEKFDVTITITFSY